MSRRNPEPNMALHGCLTLLVLAGIVATCVGQFYGMPKFWPYVLLAALVGLFFYRNLRAKV